MGQHTEEHFTAGEVVRDVVIGMSDGLTVPFALAAGLGCLERQQLPLSPSLLAWLRSPLDPSPWASEEASEVGEILADMGLEPDEYWPVVNALSKRPDLWIDFMMRFELGLEKPDPKRALQSAQTIAASYIVGGVIPLTPYIFISDGFSPLKVSVMVTLVTLLIFGFVNSRGSIRNLA